MSISTYLEKFKEVQMNLLNYIEEEENIEDNFNSLLCSIDKINIKNDCNELKLFLSLLTMISNNHHHDPNFFSRIEQILKTIKNDITKNLNKNDIFKIFKENKRIILYLLEEGVLSYGSDFFIYNVVDQNQVDENYFDYFYLGMIDKAPNDFKNKQKIGENDFYVSTLIQKDSVEEFISFVNRANLPIQSYIIENSLFETNHFLTDKKPTLIEYAAFCGSIQIFRYLFVNGAKLEPSIWFYSIHGKCPDIIHILEENKVNPPENNLMKCFEEAIKCHHNDIANYILDNCLVDRNYSLNEVLKYFNFQFIREYKFDETFFSFLCENNYITLVKLLLVEGKIDINKQII